MVGIPQLTPECRSFKEVAESLSTQLQYLHSKGLLTSNYSQENSNTLKLKEYISQLEDEIHVKQLSEMKNKLHTD